MKLSINKKTTALTLACLLSTSAFANEPTKQEKTNEIIGLGSGVVIGTVIAGPLGGVVAGAFGLLIADDVNSDAELTLVKTRLREKDQALVAMQNQYQQAKQVAMVQIASLDQALEKSTPEIESSIQFKTASHVLEQHYHPQLDLVAQTLLNNPKLTVNLSGFADQRGDHDLNQALSEQRAISVKQYLIDKGVNSDQVLTYSYGESTLVSAGESFEDDFFDRRVHLKISDNQSAITATYP